MVFESEINIYSPAATLKQFNAQETKINVSQKKISSLISDSELVELQNGNKTMYSKMMDLSLTVNSLSLSFSDISGKYTTLAGQYTQLGSKLAEYKLSVDGLSANIVAVSTKLQNEYSTTSAMNTAISAKAGEITGEVSRTYTKQSDFNAANTKIANLETWKKEASLKITDSAIVSTVTSSSTYKSALNGKLNTADLGTKIQQNATSVLIAWNNISQYIQFEQGGISVYDGALVVNKKRSVFNQDGLFFWRESYRVGHIGTSAVANNTTCKGLDFILDYQGSYMTWAYQKSATATTSDMVWTYYANTKIKSAQGLYLGANLYTDNFGIYLDSKNILLPFTNGAGIKTGNSFFVTDSWNNTMFEVNGGTTYANTLYVRNGRVVVDNGNGVDFYTNLNMRNYKIINQSDERLKMNIAPPSVDALQSLQQLEIQQYDWRESREHVEMGIIAQQAEEILPDIVYMDDKGIYSIEPLKLIPYLIRAVQQLYVMAGGSMPVNRLRSAQRRRYTDEEIEAALQAARPPEMEQKKLEPIEPKPMRLPK